MEWGSASAGTVLEWDWGCLELGPSAGGDLGSPIPSSRRSSKNSEISVFCCSSLGNRCDLIGPFLPLLDCEGAPIEVLMDNVHTIHTPQYTHHYSTCAPYLSLHCPLTCLQHGDVATGVGQVHLILQYPQTRMVEKVVVWNGDLFVPVKREWNVLHVSILTPAVDLGQHSMHLVGVVCVLLPVSGLPSGSGHRSQSGGGWRRTLTWGHDPSWLLGHDGNPCNKRR